MAHYVKANYAALADGETAQIQDPLKSAHGLGALEPFNLKTSSRCRPAAGAAGRHVSDNHKLQDAQACIRHTFSGGQKKFVIPAKGGAAVGNPLNTPKR
jgi:hypothetical protein